MNILLRRTMALGDVVLATPVLRRMRAENPQANIIVHTSYPDVFRDNPHVNTVVTGPTAQFPWIDKLVDLDLAYERRPRMHVVEAYMEEAFDDFGEGCDLRQEMFGTSALPVRLHARSVAVHAARAGWRNRTLPLSFWTAVCEGLKAAGLWPIVVGLERDALPGFTAFHSTDLHAQRRLIAGCAAFVGSDSGLLHVAGTTDTPIVGLFTCALPRLRLPRDRGRCIGLAASIACVGCLHDRQPPVTTEDCRRGDVACVTAFRAEDVVRATLDMTKEDVR